MKVLVAFDGSAGSRKALEHAAELVGRGGRVDVINVISAQPVSARLDGLGEDARRHQRRLLRDAKLVLDEWEVAMTEVRAVGDPTTEIRAAAAEVGAGVIVVGRGNGLRRLISGSVSTRLIRRAPCDVLVVH